MLQHCSPQMLLGWWPLLLGWWPLLLGGWPLLESGTTHWDWVKMVDFACWKVENLGKMGENSVKTVRNG